MVSEDNGKNKNQSLEDFLSKAADIAVNKSDESIDYSFEDFNITKISKKSKIEEFINCKSCTGLYIDTKEIGSEKTELIIEINERLLQLGTSGCLFEFLHYKIAELRELLELNNFQNLSVKNCELRKLL